MTKVFLDTNILLDVIAQREPFFGPAARIWTLAEQNSIDAYVSAISFNNLYYIVRKIEGHAKAIKALRMVRDIFTSVAPDQKILDQAMDSGLRDFEDAIQYFSANHAHVNFLITRNPGDFPTSLLPILTAREFVATLKG